MGRSGLLKGILAGAGLMVAGTVPVVLWAGFYPGGKMDASLYFILLYWASAFLAGSLVAGGRGRKAMGRGSVAGGLVGGIPLAGAIFTGLVPNMQEIALALFWGLVWGALGGGYVRWTEKFAVKKENFWRREKV